MVSDKLIANQLAKETSSGYWEAGGHYFFNKAECLRYASQVQDFNVKFHYNDEFYQSLNIRQEPTESLEELYRQRAQQLRDKYDYLVLSYSGGSDSFNVLNTFLKNNIKLDCIAISYPVKAIEKLLPSFNPEDRQAGNIIFEYTHAAMPKLHEVAKLSPETEICVLDHTDIAINMILGGKLQIMPVGGIGAAPGLAGHYLIGQKVREYSDKGKTAYVTGVDKPRMGYNPTTKKFGVWFDDISLVLGNYTKDLYSGFRPNTEHFYYSTDFPELWVKQCHVVKRAVEPIVSLEPELRPEYFKRMHYVNSKGSIILYTHNIFYKKLLYDGWHEGIFQATKPSGYFFQEHSDWYLKSDLTSHREKDFHYKQVIEFLHGIDPKFITYNERGIPLKFVDLNGPVFGI